MQDFRLKTPILFLIFNRLDTTKRVFDTIRMARPKSLYIASDGPRTSRPGEAEKVKSVRDYVASNIDWNCELKTFFNQRNLGCRVAVSKAIDWFFENESEGIILEDDCLPDPSFFAYTESLLAHYREDTRIMAISGDYFHNGSYKPRYSYFFSRYNHCWGWASWRRAWKQYDHDMSTWPILRGTDWLLMVGDGDKTFQHYWTQIFDRAYAGELDSWAYRWTFSCWAQSGLSILPARNLISNIGFGESATHTSKGQRNLANLATESLIFPLSHPLNIVRDYTADRWTHENHYKVGLINKVTNKLATIFPSVSL